MCRLPQQPLYNVIFFKHLFIYCHIFWSIVSLQCYANRKEYSVIFNFFPIYIFIFCTFIFLSWDWKRQNNFINHRLTYFPLSFLKFLLFFFWLCYVSSFPNQVWDPCPLKWKHRVLTTGPPGKSLPLSFLEAHLHTWYISKQNPQPTNQSIYNRRIISPFINTLKCFEELSTSACVTPRKQEIFQFLCYF